MIKLQILFHYNWEVRDEWFTLLEQLSDEDIQKERVGGMGSILRTLFHIVDVEQAWILLALQQLPGSHYSYEEYKSLAQVKKLSDTCRIEVKKYVQNWSDNMEGNKIDNFTFGEVMRHVIAHEIHHMGQLSVWIRELGEQHSPSH